MIGPLNQVYVWSMGTSMLLLCALRHCNRFNLAFCTLRYFRRRRRKSSPFCLKLW